MAISPIAIATQGTLNSPLSVAAVRGHLTIEDEGPVVAPGGGVSMPPWFMPGTIQHQLMQEDEEILTIIIAFMESLEE